MDPEEKRAMRARYERIVKKHHRTHEEEKRLRAQAKERKALRAASRAKQRRPARADAADGEKTFEKIRRGPRAANLRSSATDLPPSPLDLPPHARLARIVQVHKNRLRARCEDGDRRELDVPPATEAATLVVGDRIWIDPHAHAPRALAREPRSSFLARADGRDEHREHALVANVDVGVIVAAVRAPGLRPGLIQRVQIALHAGGVEPLVALNKVDLVTPHQRSELVRSLRDCGVAEIESCFVSAADGTGLAELRERLRGRTCVFLGHSGVGKSSLLNALRPGTDQPTGAGRAHDGKGRHTTSSASLFELDDGTCVIDTPGVRTFALRDLDPRQAELAFPEIARWSAQCRYTDCEHAREPGCAVLAALERGELSALTLAAYRRLFE